jgi:hypothetical protein
VTIAIAEEQRQCGRSPTLLERNGRYSLPERLDSNETGFE